MEFDSASLPPAFRHLQPGSLPVSRAWPAGARQCAWRLTERLTQSPSFLWPAGSDLVRFLRAGCPHSAHAGTHAHARSCAHTPACTHAHTHAHVHAHAHARARTHASARAHARTHTHARTHARTHNARGTHARTHMRTHTRTWASADTCPPPGAGSRGRLAAAGRLAAGG
jgi:hypothetical protein